MLTLDKSSLCYTVVYDTAQYRALVRVAALQVLSSVPGGEFEVDPGQQYRQRDEILVKHGARHAVIRHLTQTITKRRD